MDKSVRRGGGSSRFSLAKRQTGLDGDGTCGVLDKSKKEKLRRVSSLSRITLSNEMDQLSLSTSNSKRLKLPKKFFDDYNPVDHVSVPRKIRSAMKKRGHESVSPSFPNSRKSSNSVTLQAKDKRKKLKTNENTVSSPEEAILGSITKDEEEVAETLYALAGMFPENDKVDKINEKDEMSEAKSSALPVPKEVTKKICQMSSTDSSDLETSAEESVKVQTLKETTHCKSQDSKQFPVDLHNDIPPVDLPTIPLSNSTLSIVPAELSLRTGLKQMEHDETLTSGTNPKIGRGLVAAFTSQDKLKTTINDCKNNGLSSRGSPAAKLPAWLDNAACAKKDLKVGDDTKKSWKRCSAHVYICRLIKVLQITERKEQLPHIQQSIQIRPNEGSKQGALTADENLHKMINCSTADKTSNEVRNAVLLHKRLLQDQQQACSTSGLFNSSHKQTFDILSLSAGGCGMETSSNIADRSVNKLEPSTQFHANMPCLHSVGQNHAIMPLHLPQNHYSSFTDHLSAAAAEQVPIQLPSYFSNVIYDPSSHLGPTCLPKQQQMWGNNQLITPRYSLQNWQTGRYDSSPALAQAMMMPPSGSSSLEMLGSNYATGSLLEVLGPKYSHQITPQHQQQLIPFTSFLPTNRAKRQFNRLPPGYEENGGLFHLDNASTVKLLCNEHL